MSAVACYRQATGRLKAVTAFPRVPDLTERDAVGKLYNDMHRRSELLLAGELVSDLPQLAGPLGAAPNDSRRPVEGGLVARGPGQRWRSSLRVSI